MADDPLKQVFLEMTNLRNQIEELTERRRLLHLDVFNYHINQIRADPNGPPIITLRGFIHAADNN
jgi:hypothetical protein